MNSNFIYEYPHYLLRCAKRNDWINFVSFLQAIKEVIIMNGAAVVDGDGYCRDGGSDNNNSNRNKKKKKNLKKNRTWSPQVPVSRLYTDTTGVVPPFQSQQSFIHNKVKDSSTTTTTTINSPEMGQDTIHHHSSSCRSSKNMNRNNNNNNNNDQQQQQQHNHTIMEAIREQLVIRDSCNNSILIALFEYCYDQPPIHVLQTYMDVIDTFNEQCNNNHNNKTTKCLLNNNLKEEKKLPLNSSSNLPSKKNRRHRSTNRTTAATTTTTTTTTTTAIATTIGSTKSQQQQQAQTQTQQDTSHSSTSTEEIPIRKFRSKKGFTALHVACSNGSSIHILRILLSIYPNDFINHNNQRNYLQRTNPCCESDIWLGDDSGSTIFTDLVVHYMLERNTIRYRDRMLPFHAMNHHTMIQNEYRTNYLFQLFYEKLELLLQTSWFTNESYGTTFFHQNRFVVTTNNNNNKSTTSTNNKNNDGLMNHEFRKNRRKEISKSTNPKEDEKIIQVDTVTTIFSSFKDLMSQIGYVDNDDCIVMIYRPKECMSLVHGMANVCQSFPVVLMDMMIQYLYPPHQRILSLGCTLIGSISSMITTPMEEDTTSTSTCTKEESRKNPPLYQKGRRKSGTKFVSENCRVNHNNNQKCNAPLLPFHLALDNKIMMFVIRKKVALGKRCYRYRNNNNNRKGKSSYDPTTYHKSSILFTTNETKMIFQYLNRQVTFIQKVLQWYPKAATIPLSVLITSKTNHNNRGVDVQNNCCYPMVRGGCCNCSEKSKNDNKTNRCSNNNTKNNDQPVVLPKYNIVRYHKINTSMLRTPFCQAVASGLLWFHCEYDNDNTKRTCDITTVTTTTTTSIRIGPLQVIYNAISRIRNDQRRRQQKQQQQVKMKQTIQKAKRQPLPKNRRKGSKQQQQQRLVYNTDEEDVFCVRDTVTGYFPFWLAAMAACRNNHSIPFRSFTEQHGIMKKDTTTTTSRTHLVSSKKRCCCTKSEKEPYDDMIHRLQLDTIYILVRKYPHIVLNELR